MRIDPIAAAYFLIALCVACAIVIEIRARRMRGLMQKRVAALYLTHYSVCAQCGASQANSNNREQNNIQHRSSPLTG